MKTVYLTRSPSTDEGTFGQLTVDDAEWFECKTGELPWRDSKNEISCIPVGEYICKFQFAPKKKVWHYFLQDVPGRTGVMIHVGNYCGDESKGFKSDVEGCILLGELIGELHGQQAILKSGDTVDAFEKMMNKEDFLLIILEEEDVPDAA